MCALSINLKGKPEGATDLSLLRMWGRLAVADVSCNYAIKTNNFSRCVYQRNIYCERKHQSRHLCRAAGKSCDLYLELKSNPTDYMIK